MTHRNHSRQARRDRFARVRRIAKQNESRPASHAGATAAATGSRGRFEE